MASPAHSTIPLSSLFSDIALRAIFESVERDNGFCFAIPAPVEPVLLDGAEAEIECEYAFEMA